MTKRKSCKQVPSESVMVRDRYCEQLQILFAVQNHVKNSSQAAWAVMNIQMNVFGIPDSNSCVSEAMMRQKRVSLNDKWQAQTHTT